MSEPDDVSTDARPPAPTDAGEPAPAPPTEPRNRRWIEFGWRPVGAPRTPDRDGLERRRRAPELYITDHRAARIISAALAVGVAVGCVFWAREAADRFDLPTLVCAGCAPPDWFRWLQLLGAIAGIAMALVQIAYMVNFAARGVVWRRWRGVGIAFGSLAAGWTILWWIDYLWI